MDVEYCVRLVCGILHVVASLHFRVTTPKSPGFRNWALHVVFAVTIARIAAALTCKLGAWLGG